jgi:hypothetical protein
MRPCSTWGPILTCLYDIQSLIEADPEGVLDSDEAAFVEALRTLIETAEGRVDVTDDEGATDG